ncbi:hypothetical protein BN2475_10017 [Paraburkholderia ribeironis]|uniref:Uncharacterized protein n=1 Tax=Paraburkholderia ribeironis TaxID=1247936 RepID=A0A1N7RIB6_9BURK|nr:hypothetical protein [Paraburkholderia ribeironis]SIT34861.1 hypothetical protein BN2475_10017 [Paraburkholderia ribeironis]
MQSQNLSQTQIPNRRTAIAYHRRLKEENAPILKMGRFYLSMVERNLWPSQTAMAFELGVSIFQISRTIAAARLPESVVGLFASKSLSFADVATLRKLVKEVGEAEVVERSKSVSPDAPTREIFSILTSGKASLRNGVRISRVRGQNYLRLDVPNIEEIAPHIQKLEQMLNLLLLAGGTSDWADRSMPGEKSTARTQSAAGNPRSSA